MKSHYRIILTRRQVRFLNFDKLPKSMELLADGTVASYLTEEQFSKQLDAPDSYWHCPITGQVGTFDDEWYESWNVDFLSE